MNTPAHLTEAQKAIWEEYSQEFDLDPVDYSTLEAVCVHLDRARQAGEEIKERGLIFLTNNGATQMANPAIKVEKDSHTLAVRLLDQLRKKYSTKTKEATKTRSPRMEINKNELQDVIY